jgi:hypothetical protein
MNKLQVVVPIGIGAPGTPVQKYFEEGINSLLAQTTPIDICIAADENVPDRIKDFIKEKNLNVKWFGTNSFYKKGGIWTKLFDTWQESDSEFVAFMHYDDLWDKDKAKLQLEHIESLKMNGSWTETYYIDGDSKITSGDCAFITEFTKETIGKRSAAFAHSFIVNKEKLMNSGILASYDKWTAIFEDVWVLYMGSIGNMKKTVGSKFFWRNHDMNMSNTGNLAYVKEDMEKAQYSVEDVWADANSMNATLQAVYAKALQNL